jgi:hypothetical protein
MVLIFLGMKSPLKPQYFASFVHLTLGEIHRVFFQGRDMGKR